MSQPAVFAVEYALASRLLDWGIRPQAMVGFSIGEYVAACLSGVLSLDDALRLVAGRARLIDELPGGAMLAVPLGEEAVAPWLAGGLSLAAVAGPELTVLAGTEEAVAAAEERLTAAGPRLPPAADVSRLPFGADGAGGGALPGALRGDRAASAGDPLSLERHRPLDHRRSRRRTPPTGRSTCAARCGSRMR